jgi:fimbrial isopeptide formation D2 family protein
VQKQNVVFPFATGLALLAGTVGQPVAMATVPTPTSTQSVISIEVGGTRNGDAIDLVPGVVLRLRDGSTATPGAYVTESWATCTSDAQGDCSFVIPDTNVAQPAGNRDRRFFIVADSVPAGYYFTPTVVTSMDGYTYTDTPYAIRTPITLHPGQTYTSTSNFMVTASGVEASSGIFQISRDNPAAPTKCGINVALIMDLSYSVEESHALPQLQDAAKGLTNSLVGTDSQVAIYTFGRYAPANSTNDANHDLAPVSTQAGADVVNGWIDAITIPVPAQSTNWDRGLYQVAQQQANLPAGQRRYDVAIIITDGDPTRFGPGSGNGSASTGIATRFAELEHAVFSANALKAQGTRVIAFGVGPDVSGSAANLAAISGPVQDSDYYLRDWNNVADALQSLALKGCASSVSNTASLTVIKQVLPNSWTITDPYTQAVAQGGWNMAVSTPASVTVNGGGNSATGSTSVGTGAVSFSVDLGATTSAVFTVDEQIAAQGAPLNSYLHQPYQSADANCSLLSDSGTTPLAVDNLDGQESFAVTIRPGDVASCVIYNQIPAAAPAPASLRVDKYWVIDGVSYRDGAQPTQFSATLSLDDVTAGTGVGQAIPYDNVSWGYSYTGLQVGMLGRMRESVTFPDGCAFADGQPDNPASPTDPTPVAFSGVTGSRTDFDTGTPTGQVYNIPVTYPDSSGVYHITSYTDELVAADNGQNRWRITNYVTCASWLSLVKYVRVSPHFQLPYQTPFSWKLSLVNTEDPTDYVDVTPGVIFGDAHTGTYFTDQKCGANPLALNCYPDDSTYANSEPIAVKPGVLYTLSESNTQVGARAYAQELAHGAAGKLVSGATGSWQCIPSDPETGAALGPPFPDGDLGQVLIPVGTQLTICTAYNDTAEFTATKTVEGGTATAADWTYTVTPSGTVKAGAPEITGVGWGIPSRILPRQEYTIAESAGPSGYKLTSLQCSWHAPSSVDGYEYVHHNNEDITANPKLTVMGDFTATCSFTNTALTDLNITKQAVGAPTGGLHVGDSYSYLITVTAGSAFDAKDVRVTDTIPADLTVNGASFQGTPENCTWGTPCAWTVQVDGNTVTATAPGLAAGKSAVIKVDVTVKTASSKLTNTACVTAANVDGQKCADVDVPPTSPTPTPEPTDSPEPTPEPTPTTPPLPVTGADPSAPTFIALLFVVAGAYLVSRRRR